MRERRGMIVVVVLVDVVLVDGCSCVSRSSWMDYSAVVVGQTVLLRYYDDDDYEENY